MWSRVVFHIILLNTIKCCSFFLSYSYRTSKLHYMWSRGLMSCSSFSGQPFSSLVLDEAVKVLHVSSILLLGFWSRLRSPFAWLLKSASKVTFHKSGLPSLILRLRILCIASVSSRFMVLLSLERVTGIRGFAYSTCTSTGGELLGTGKVLTILG